MRVFFFFVFRTETAPARCGAPAAPSRATFDNPDHDYPQRISYRRDGEALVATISAIDDSHATRWTCRRH